MHTYFKKNLGICKLALSVSQSILVFFYTLNHFNCLIDLAITRNV